MFYIRLLIALSDHLMFTRIRADGKKVDASSVGMRERLKRQSVVYVPMRFVYAFILL